MMLNRDNYEMYFLLYIDNELDDLQRREVEDFILQHPDLAVELADLQNTLLTEDTVVFPDKELLYKQTDNETSLLLYIDNELSEAERSAFEQDCETNPALQQQLQQFQQVVLPSEHIVFEHKESLYRHAHGRVIAFSSFNRRMLSAAAILACVAVTGWWLLGRVPSSSTSLVTETEQSYAVSGEVIEGRSIEGYDDKPDEPVIAGIGQQTIATNSKSGQQSTLLATKGSLNTTLQSSYEGTVANTANRHNATTGLTVKGQQFIALTQPVKRISTAQPATTTALPVTMPTAQQPVVAQQATIKKQPEVRQQYAATIMEAPQQELSQLPAQTSTSTLAAMTPAVQKTPATMVKPAVYKELDMADEGNESLYIGNLELNKNKVAGIFRRAGRLFGNKASNAEKNL